MSARRPIGERSRPWAAAIGGYLVVAFASDAAGAGIWAGLLGLLGGIAAYVATKRATARDLELEVDDRGDVTVEDLDRIFPPGSSARKIAEILLDDRSRDRNDEGGQ